MAPPSERRQALDSCARLHLGRKRRLSSYTSLGAIGILAGIVVATLLAARTGASSGSVVISTVAAPAGFVLGMLVSRMVREREVIVFYEMLAAVVVTAAAALAIAGEPVLAGLDLVVIAVGTFLVFGRIGCFAVGCCHGRPARWGIVYGADHARLGFPEYYVGRRLFPVQLVEAVLTAAATAAATVWYCQADIGGETVGLFVILYGSGRFLLELARGDAARPNWRGPTAAQWTALVSSAAVAISAFAGGWTIAPVAAAATGVLVVAAVLLLVVHAHPRWSPYRLRQPWTLAELAPLVQHPSADAAPTVHEAPASGLRVSTGQTGEGAVHVTISRPRHALDDTSAQAVRECVELLLRRPVSELRPGAHPGLFHLILSAGDLD